MRTYAIGDIHGQLEMLKGAHALIAADRLRASDSMAPVVHLGDFVDRGPDSKGVVQFLIDGQEAQKPWITLKGNHDRMFAWFLEPEPRHDPYLFVGLYWFHDRLGGGDTLRSYGVDVHGRVRNGDLHDRAVSAVPAAHIRFLENCLLHYQRGEVLFVHAGILPGVDLADQAENDLLWIRDGFLNDKRDHGPLIVHGHTALEEATHFGNRIDLDSGAGYGRPITVAVFEDRDCFILTESGRVPLIPGQTAAERLIKD